MLLKSFKFPVLNKNSSICQLRSDSHIFVCYGLYSSHVVKEIFGNTDRKKQKKKDFSGDSQTCLRLFLVFGKLPTGVNVSLIPATQLVNVVR